MKQNNSVTQEIMGTGQVLYQSSILIQGNNYWKMLLNGEFLWMNAPDMLTCTQVPPVSFAFDPWGNV